MMPVERNTYGNELEALKLISNDIERRILENDQFDSDDQVFFTVNVYIYITTLSTPGVFAFSSTVDLAESLLLVQHLLALFVDT